MAKAPRHRASAMHRASVRQRQGCPCQKALARIKTPRCIDLQRATVRKPLIQNMHKHIIHEYAAITLSTPIPFWPNGPTPTENAP